MTRYITIPIKESTVRKIRCIYDDNIVSYLKISVIILCIICMISLFTVIGAIIGAMIIIGMKIPTPSTSAITMADMIIIVSIAAVNVIGFTLINLEGEFIKLEYARDEVPKKESGCKLKPL